MFHNNILIAKFDRYDASYQLIYFSDSNGVLYCFKLCSKLIRNLAKIKLDFNKDFLIKYSIKITGITHSSGEVTCTFYCDQLQKLYNT